MFLRKVRIGQWLVYQRDIVTVELKPQKSELVCMMSGFKACEVYKYPPNI